MNPHILMSRARERVDHPSHPSRHSRCPLWVRGRGRQGYVSPGDLNEGVLSGKEEDTPMVGAPDTLPLQESPSPSSSLSPQEEAHDPEKINQDRDGEVPVTSPWRGWGLGQITL